MTGSKGPQVDLNLGTAVKTQSWYVGLMLYQIQYANRVWLVLGRGVMFSLLPAFTVEKKSETHPIINTCTLVH